MKTVQEYVEESPLTPTEQTELLEALSGMSDADSAALAGRFEENPWLVPYLYVNFAAKKYALSKGDPEAFTRVVESEQVIVEDLDTPA